MSFLRFANNRIIGLAEKSQPWLWLLFRILVAAMFVTHGFNKLFVEPIQPILGGTEWFGIAAYYEWDDYVDLDNFPNSLWVAGVVQFWCGLMVLVGLFTRWAAALCAAVMVCAYIQLHLAWFPTLNQGELAAIYFVAFLAITAYGPGKYSLDHRIFGK